MMIMMMTTMTITMMMIVYTHLQSGIYYCWASREWVKKNPCEFQNRTPDRRSTVNFLATS